MEYIVLNVKEKYFEYQKAEEKKEKENTPYTNEFSFFHRISFVFRVNCKTRNGPNCVWRRISS